MSFGLGTFEAGRGVFPGLVVDDAVLDLRPHLRRRLADSVGLALMVVLESLSPAERLVFVLHDLFAVPFAEVGAVVGAAPRRRSSWPAGPGRGCVGRVLTATATEPRDGPRHREVVTAFLALRRRHGGRPA